jgi:hypothetical protein
MLKYIIFFFSASILLFSCSGSSVPEGVIDRTRMTNLLTQVHLIDGGLYNVAQNPDSLYKYGTGRYLALFKNFNTNPQQFKNSLKYYSSQPEDLLAMYDQVLLNLKQKSDSLLKLQLKKPNALPSQ